jgi:uncharacterized protein
MGIDPMNTTMTEERPAPAAIRLGGALTAFILGLPALLLVALVCALFLAPGRAHAAGAMACEGKSLVESLKSKSPELYAEALREGEATPNGQGRFWRIGKPGLDPSYLFGTMHVTDPRVTELPATAESAFDSADIVVIETVDILDPQKAQLALLGKPELTMFTDGSTLQSLLGKEDLALVEAELDRRGIPLALVSRMKPWMIAGMVALPDCETVNKQAGVAFLDQKIAETAKADGKELKGLESIGEQLNAMNSLPMEFHLKGLVETIKLGDLMPDIMATMTDLYLQGDIAMIMPVITASSPEGLDEEAEAYAQFEDRIIRMRNHVMAERAAPILEKGGAFIAVGALHLPGEEGLVALLREAGYEVSRAE